MGDSQTTVMRMQVLGPEELAAAIRSANLEPCQLSRAPAPSRLARVMCPEVCLDFAEIGPAMLFTGLMPVDCYTLVFVTKCPAKGHSFNFSVEHNDGYMGFFPPGGVLDAHTPEGYANATLTVPSAVFLDALERSFPEIPEKILKWGVGLRVDPVAQGRMNILLAAVMETIENPPGPLSGLAARRELERFLLDAFLGALRSGIGGGLAARSHASREK